MKNNIRYDLSRRLIHFFREVDIKSDRYVSFPENWGFDHIVENNVFSPFFLLRSAIRKGRLYATWSIRNHKHTIYGKNPAVCFTEMPLAAFLMTSKQRRELGEAISPYGISFIKNDLFTHGARPVIYGLSISNFKFITSDKEERIINENQLPILEQYRYVAFNPLGEKKLTGLMNENGDGHIVIVLNHTMIK